jgi:hypothetical protein
MNCKEVEEMIPDLARGVEIHKQALAHVKNCLRCSERLADEETLALGLAGWAEASRGEQAPARVEEALLSAYRRNSDGGRRWRGWIPAAGSVAAALVLAKLFTPAAPPVAPVAPPKVEAVATVVAAPPVIAPDPPENRAPRRVARRVRPQSPRPAEIGFLPVAQRDGWTPFDGGRLVRVGLPRTALRAFGLPMAEERASEQVQADVMLSNDGLVRAIRFVK